uniref:BRO1 domain-containing protein n=1 Tax=Minutocellus polymorphus TaxID=265543 RepID=A0A7S0B0Q7_9STRA|mmetsp:Transcript_8646/g.14228  ORF Transcript_8646/g.14228 Transcript_8646/m.14228 type:complete len:399 (+) Transcript_8646:32-1228(+)
MLIIIPLKTSKQYDIRAPLATWVDSSNPYITSEHVRDDLVRLSSLRNCLTAGSICTAYAHSAAIGARGMEYCMEYHACLLEAEKRGFPTVDDAMVGAKELKISWNCAFGEEEPIVRSNVRYERACVLFDVASLQSFMGATEDISTKEGRSKATKMFGMAATTFGHLRRELMDGECRGENPSADLSSPALRMCEHINLAQGQYCAYEAATNRPTQLHGLLGKIAAATADLYGSALEYSQDPILKARLPDTSKSYGAHLKTMSIYFRAKAEYHQSQVCKAGHSYAEEIARLRFVQSCCDDALKYQSETSVLASSTGAIRTTGQGVALARDIDHLRRVVSGRKDAVEKENREIYMEIIIDHKDLEEIVPANMMAEEKLPPLDERLDPHSLTRPIFNTIPRI